MTTELIDLDTILAKYSEELTQEEIDMFDINFLLESLEVEIDENLLNFEF